LKKVSHAESHGVNFVKWLPLIFAISSMSRENSNASTLNARERKLPRDSQGKIVTKDSTRQQQSDEKEMRKFFETLH
jgi:hypothetical protein